MQLIERSSASLSSYSGQSARNENYVDAQPTAPAEADAGILMRLRRRKLLFGTVFAAVAGLTAGAYLYLPPVYRATAAVTIQQPERILASQDTAGTSPELGDSSDLESQAVILGSPLLIRELLKKPEIMALLRHECDVTAPPEWKTDIRNLLQMQPHPSCDQQLADTKGLVGSLKGRLGVATNGRSRIIDVNFTSALPEVAQAIANGVVETYLNAETREKLQPRDRALEWLRDESQRVATRLQTTEAKIDSFLHANNVIRGQVAPIASEQLSSLSQQLSVAQADKATAAGRLSQVKSQGSSNTAVLDSRAVSDVKQQIAVITAQIGSLSARYGDANPQLQELIQTRRNLEGLLGRETSLVNRSADADYQSASNRVQTLQAQIDSLKQQVRGNDNATTQVASLQRDAVTDRELYVDLTKSLNQLETNRRLVTANARLVNLAELPQGVFFPKLSTFALTGFMLALALATTTALLRDRADRTIRTVDGLEGAAGLRVLARVPHVPHVGAGSSRLAKRMQKPSAFQEAIRALYAECMLLSLKRRGAKPLHSIMVCSANTGEGKSFITLALAHFAVAAGQRVLILECDMRRPSIGRSLAVPPRRGVTDILRQTSTPEEAVTSVRGGSLDVILAGAPSMDSTELLGGPAFRRLLDWAGERYDLVLIDSPPSRALADARIMASEVDGILYCAQWGHSHTSSVLEGVAELRAAGGRMLGMVLDRLESDEYRLYDANVQAGSYLATNRS